MNIRCRLMAALLAGVLALELPTLVYADGANERTGVNNENGNPSPAAGFSAGETNSRIDDYFNQDEQINIDGGKTGVVKVLRVNQKNLINDFVVGIFPIKHASPIELRNLFREVTAAEGGRAEVIRDGRSKENFLWVLAPKFQLPHLEATLREIDVPWLSDDLDGAAEVYYKAKFRTIDRIDAIASVPGSSGLRGTDADSNVDLDRVNNASLYIGEPYRAGNYVKYSEKVDQPVPQVVLEAAVYEVEVSNDKRLGLDYIAWKNGPGRNLFEFIFWGSSSKQHVHGSSSVFDPFLSHRTAVAVSDTIKGHSSGWYMATNFLATAAYLDFLEGSGRARVVTRGKVRVKNSELGTLSATDQVLYFRSSPNESNTPTDGIVPSLVQVDTTNTDLPIHSRTLTKDSKVEIGFTMTVRPRIGQETTEITVDLSLGNIVGQTPSGAPLVRTHTVSSTVLVRDGLPFCVGGIRRDEEVNQTQKIPLLGSIPVLGWLFFGHEATGKRNTEVVAAPIPTIGSAPKRTSRWPTTRIALSVPRWSAGRTWRFLGQSLALTSG